MPLNFRKTVHHKFCQDLSTLGLFHEGMNKEVLGAWPQLRIDRQTLFYKVFKLTGALIWIRQSLWRVIFNDEHGSHRMNVRERRFAFGEFDASNA